MGKHKKHIVKVKTSSTIKDFPIWRFDKIDRDGRFAFNLSRQDFDHREVLQKLLEYGNMTWDDIGKQKHDYSQKTKHHYLDLSALSDIAIKRIEAKRLVEETDAIYSFSLQNKLRIIGIRYGAEFHIVWYDPNHEFCPSKKR